MNDKTKLQQKLIRRDKQIAKLKQQVKVLQEGLQAIDNFTDYRLCDVVGKVRGEYVTNVDNIPLIMRMMAQETLEKYNQLMKN